MAITIRNEINRRDEHGIDENGTEIKVTKKKLSNEIEKSVYGQRMEDGGVRKVEKNLICCR